MITVEQPLFVGGRWCPANGDALETIDPASGAVLWSGRAASPVDVAAAVSAARTAVPAWSGLPHARREEVLMTFAALLSEHKASLAGTISRETGKPHWEAATEVQSMIGKIPLAIEAHARRCGEFKGGAAVTRFRPHGVVAVLGPFNFPGHLPNGHIAPALLAGNTVVFKPSELTPWTAQRAVELWQRAGLPEGALNLVPGGRSTGEALAAHPGIDGLFFTGSAATGLALHRRFADHPEKILALEMGGNNPLVIHAARDHAAAALLTVQSAFLSAGQRCTCARRLIVPVGEEGDAFVAALVALMGRIRVGAPADEPEPFMGPVIRPQVAQRLLDAQRDLAERGARVLVAMRQLRAGTGLVAPALLDVTAVRDRADEELFGPLLQLIRLEDFSAAIAEANRTRFGLAAGLLSDDRACWERFCSGVRVGILNWNQPLTGASSAAPFGGVGLSGNHRPSAWFAADYCSHAVAMIENPELKPPQAQPGIE
jgi:succinylglutamic semialdehyde dehydrogenase